MINFSEVKNFLISKLKQIKKEKLFLITFFAIVLFLVQSCHKEPVACFTVTPQEIYSGDTVHLTNCSVNCDVYKWHFPDGEESLDKDPSYVFNTEWPVTKEFTITLAAKAKYGVFDYAEQVIKVHPIHERFTGSYVGIKTIDGEETNVSIVISNNGMDTDLLISGLFEGGIYAEATSSTKISISPNMAMHEQPFSGSGTLTDNKSLNLVVIHTNIYTQETTTITFVGEVI